MAHDVSAWMRQDMKKSGAATGPCSMHSKIAVKGYADGGEVEGSTFNDDPVAVMRENRARRAAVEAEQQRVRSNESEGAMSRMRDLEVQAEAPSSQVQAQAAEALEMPAAAPRESVGKMTGLESEARTAANRADKASYSAGDFKPVPVKTAARPVASRPAAKVTDTGDETARLANRYAAPAKVAAPAPAKAASQPRVLAPAAPNDSRSASVIKKKFDPSEVDPKTMLPRNR